MLSFYKTGLAGLHDPGLPMVSIFLSSFFLHILFSFSPFLFSSPNKSKV
jgi:hypothetical protein